tara:strand:- start:4695 stop:4823 length:129 start_codon:yes stop_codon:yes gene_type:complete
MAANTTQREGCAGAAGCAEDGADGADSLLSFQISLGIGMLAK